MPPTSYTEQPIDFKRGMSKDHSQVRLRKQELDKCKQDKLKLKISQKDMKIRELNSKRDE